jgi:hypothetical protein
VCGRKKKPSSLQQEELGAGGAEKCWRGAVCLRAETEMREPRKRNSRASPAAPIPNARRRKSRACRRRRKITAHEIETQSNRRREKHLLRREDASRDETPQRRTKPLGRRATRETSGAANPTMTQKQIRPEP